MIEGDFWAKNLQEAKLGGIAIPTRTVRRSGGRRVARHEYPYRDGQDIEDLGRSPLRWEIDVPLFAGMEPATPGVPLYPDVFAQLRNAFDGISELGQVEWVDPELGPVNVKIIGHEWNATADQRNGGVYRLQLEEVSEEPFLFNVRSIENARGAAVREAAAIDENLDVPREEILSSWDALGLSLEIDLFTRSDIFTVALKDFTDRLDEGVMAADEVAADVDRMRSRIRAVIERPEITDASQWATYVGLVNLADAIGEVGERALRAAPQLVDYVVPEVQSHWTIALTLYGDRTRAAEIAQRNPVKNPLMYPRGMVLKVLSE